MGYSVAILSVGFFVDYSQWIPAIKDGSMNLGTVPYMLLQNLGEAVGHALGLSTSGADMLGGILPVILVFQCFLPIWVLSLP